jgi:hypothetical protein
MGFSSRDMRFALDRRMQVGIRLPGGCRETVASTAKQTTFTQQTICGSVKYYSQQTKAMSTEKSNRALTILPMPAKCWRLEAYYLLKITLIKKRSIHLIATQTG